MTASLPLPDDQMPETEGESGAESVRETTDSPRPVSSPRASAKDPATTSAPRRPARPKTSTARTPRKSSPTSASTTKRTPRAAASDGKTVSEPAAPRKPRAPRATKPVQAGPVEQAAPAVDPGPPPPLPDHIVVPSGLVIPPRPPLPPAASSPDDAVVEGKSVAAAPVVAEPIEAEVLPESEAPSPLADIELEPEAVAIEPQVEPVTAEPDAERPERETDSAADVASETTEAELEPDLAPAAFSEADTPSVHLEVVSVDEPKAVETVEPPETEVEAADDEAEPADLVDAEPADLVGAEPADLVDAEPQPIDDSPADAAALTVLLSEPDAASDTDTPAPALRLRGVTKRFGETLAVDAIDLTVPAGSFYGLVGPNGAGKTTTLSMIAGLLRPDGGEITVGGIDSVKRASESKRRMGVLPDRLRTFDRLTGRQLLYYYGVLRGLPSAVVESRTNDLARAFDLVDALGRSVSDYSAGMTKKVMLAGAMIHSPRLLVLDEPFESVDPVSSAVILDILTTYVEHGGTVILSSHGMELVERVCSGVAVLVAGHVLAEGTVDEVRGELTLEERFLELAGGSGDLEGLEWLHTFSD